MDEKKCEKITAESRKRRKRPAEKKTGDLNQAAEKRRRLPIHDPCRRHRNGPLFNRRKRKAVTAIEQRASIAFRPKGGGTLFES